jgi:hypothetical protein
MSTVQEVAFSFDYSSKKLQAFYQELDSDATTNMDKRTKLCTLCETRWTSRADALYTFKTSFPVVVHALERLQGLEDDKAGQYLASICICYSSGSIRTHFTEYGVSVEIPARYRM